MKKVFWALVFFLAAFLGGLFWWQWATGANVKCQMPNLKCQEEIFVIEKGEGLNSIAERLQKERLIRSSLAFKILVWKEGLGKKIQAGDFRLSAGMTPLEIGRELTHGTLDKWFTIIEGWRREEIGQKLAADFANFSHQDFLGKTQDLEGYLFPDTYLIPKEATAGAMAGIFLKNFRKKIDTGLEEAMSRQGLTLGETLILASMVEREARYEADRPVVAGILIKRWQNNWPLQVDATAQYAVATAKCFNKIRRAWETECKWWPKSLTGEDLKISSPFNTYLHRGLPKSPICNPSLSAIRAVVFPVATDYWFYLTDQNGQMHYARTDAEQAANIRRYLRGQL